MQCAETWILPCLLVQMSGGVASDGLRHVEKDVLITKKMRGKAMELCAGYVKGGRG